MMKSTVRGDEPFQWSFRMAMYLGSLTLLTRSHECLDVLVNMSINKSIRNQTTGISVRGWGVILIDCIERIQMVLLWLVKCHHKTTAPTLTVFDEVQVSVLLVIAVDIVILRRGFDPIRSTAIRLKSIGDNTLTTSTQDKIFATMVFCLYCID